MAVVDSGTFGLHPDLTKRMKKNVKFENATGTLSSAQAPGQCQTNTSSGHGTQVSGTVAGDGTGSSGFFQGARTRASSASEWGTARRSLVDHRLMPSLYSTPP